MLDLGKEAKRMADSHGYDLTVRRKSKLDPKTVKTLKVDPKVYLFILAYARKNQLFLQEATDEILKTGIKNIFFKEPKDILSPGKIMRFIHRKGPAQAKDTKPQK